MRIYEPLHPGVAIPGLCLAPLDLTVGAAAAALGVTRKTLSEFLNGRAGISPEMSLRLAQAFNTASESWLGMQMEYDLWRTKKRVKRLKVKRLAA